MSSADRPVPGASFRISAANVCLSDTPDQVAREVAGRVVRLAQGARDRPFRIGLPGGRSPARLYRLLAGEYASQLDPARLEILFADERAVPPDDPDSNYRLVKETLLAGLRIPEAQVHRMRGEADDLEAAAREYETHLTQPLDLLLLGVGEDGHVASLFPGSPLLEERTRRVAVVYDSPKPPPRRLTITPRVMSEAYKLMVIATGADKAAAVAAALARDGSVVRCPARLAAETFWYLDRDAASLVSPLGRRAAQR